ncbi:putative transcription factor B3-Domain family [Helianthus anomalus]
MINHESQRSWTVYLRSISGESVITDGWSNVVRDLHLTKQTFLRLRIMEDKNIEMDCFVENICGESLLNSKPLWRFKDNSKYTNIYECISLL